MYVEAGETQKYIQSIDNLSDSISDEFAIENNCGAIEYEILDTDDEPAPKFVTLVKKEG